MRGGGGGETEEEGGGKDTRDTRSLVSMSVLPTWALLVGPVDIVVFCS